VDWIELLAALAVILFGAQLFTNGVEWIGEAFGLSEGAVGSVLAAIGTALPETLLPLIAILSSGSVAGDEIGIGAILGAPFMLSTLAMFVLGVSLVGFARGGRRETRLLAEASVIRQDLGFFVVMYALAVVAGVVHARLFRWTLAPALLIAYGAYVGRHFRSPGGREAESEAAGEVRPLYLLSWWDRPRRAAVPTGRPPTWLAAGQTLIALGLIIGGAKIFVLGIDQLAKTFQVPSLVFALLVAPVATELPVSVGLLLTPWHLSQDGLVAAVVALVAGVWLYVAVRMLRTLPAWLLMLQVVLYAGYVGYVLTRI
jgi:cation:H+ antiporter